MKEDMFDEPRAPVSQALERPRSKRELRTTLLPPAPRPMGATGVKRLRARLNASQAVFARYLNVSTGLISQWERGEKRPGGASLKLLTLIAKRGLQSVA